VILTQLRVRKVRTGRYNLAIARKETNLNQNQNVIGLDIISCCKCRTNTLWALRTAYMNIMQIDCLQQIHALIAE